MDKRLFEKSKKLYITYDGIYRNAKYVSNSLFKANVILLFIAFGILGNFTLNPNADKFDSVIETIIIILLMVVSTVFANHYQHISEKYRNKASKEYGELIK